MATNLYMAQIYINNVQALKSYMNKLNPELKYYDIEKIKDKINDAVDKLSFQLKDIRLSTEFKSVYDGHKQIYNVIRGSLKTYESLEQIISLKPFVDMIMIDEIENTRLYDMIKAADHYYYDSLDSYDMSADYLSHIYRSIKNTNGLNIFAPNCFNGLTVSRFAKEKDKTFGNSTNYISRAKELMTRVIKGELKGSHITNNYFDVVFLTPKVTYKLNTDPFGKIAEPNEKVFIKNCVKYCRQDGLLVMTLPATRVDASFAFYLSKVLSDNTIIVKEPNSRLERITIIGQKHITQKSKPELYERLKYINYDQIPEAEFIIPTFDIPMAELTLDFFRGSTLDTDDILEATQSNLINSFLDSQTQPLVVKDQSPLLPFNIGQVGLVLTSGCLDGVVEEVDGIYHVIKGMTTKLTTTQTEVSETDNKVKSTETISNQVKINVFTADGEFISLG
jgi:hypothetical protein